MPAVVAGIWQRCQCTWGCALLLQLCGVCGGCPLHLRRTECSGRTPLPACPGPARHLFCQSAGGYQWSSPWQVYNTIMYTCMYNNVCRQRLLFALSSLSPSSLMLRVGDVFSEKRDDPTSLTSVLRDTELVGLLRLLYAMLLHDGPPRHSSSPPPLPPHTLSISTACLKAINNFAILDLRMVQVGSVYSVSVPPILPFPPFLSSLHPPSPPSLSSLPFFPPFPPSLSSFPSLSSLSLQTCLGAEGISLEFRHVTSYLMWLGHYHFIAVGICMGSWFIWHV